jgi:hypothetical protein
MAVASSSDVAILALGVVLAAAYLFRDSIFSPSTPKAVSVAPSKLANGHGNPRDFIAKMKEGVSYQLPSFVITSMYHISDILVRKNVSLYSMVRKLVLPRNMPSALPKKPKPSSDSHLSFATPRNTTLRI